MEEKQRTRIHRLINHTVDCVGGLGVQGIIEGRGIWNFWGYGVLEIIRIVKLKALELRE